MSLLTKPVFIVSTGRSGTQMMEKLFSNRDEICLHHEYCCLQVQPLAARWYMGLMSRKAVLERLREIQLAAVTHATTAWWGDSSNKLSWLIPELAELMPDAHFVHLIRDGRKVVSSFFHKLGDECYDDDSTAAMQHWLAHPDERIPPPPEKKYWWNIPPQQHADAKDFAGFDQFQRIAWHWSECNKRIAAGRSAVAADQWLQLRLEDLVSDEQVTRSLFAFLQMPYDKQAFQTLQRPHNVNVPQDHLLTDVQSQQFWDIAGEQMQRYGYADVPEYRMRYGQAEVVG